LVKAMDWDDQEKEAASWLNYKRNLYMHKGYTSVEERGGTIENVSLCISLFKDLYLQLEYSLERVFSPIELILLQSSSSEWE
jgi:hypothetical protein